MSISKEADNIYLNITIPGNTANYNTTGPGIPNSTTPPTGEEIIPAYYKVTKTAPIINNPEEYYCSIVRFVVPLASLPIFIMPIVPNTYVSPASPGNPNLSTLVFSFRYLGIDYSSFVEFINFNPVLTPPIQNQITQVVTTYYYVYSYQQLLDCVNRTLISLWNTSGLSTDYPLLQHPFFRYDTNTELISVIVPNIFTGVTPVVELSMNNVALNYFDGFPFFFYGFNQPHGRDYVFQFYDYPGNSYPFPFTTSTQFQYTQEYNTLYFWSALRKLLFVSSTLPINNEITQSSIGNGVYTSFPIITDFALETSAAGSCRSIAVYNPTGPYRLVSLSGNAPISSVDIQIFWSDLFGNIYPLLLPQDQLATIKLAFFKKSLYNNKV
jgi:hypothetical protein